jgi:hypothetical protein
MPALSRLELHSTKERKKGNESLFGGGGGAN